MTGELDIITFELEGRAEYRPAAASAPNLRPQPVTDTTEQAAQMLAELASAISSELSAQPEGNGTLAQRAKMLEDKAKDIAKKALARAQQSEPIDQEPPAHVLKGLNEAAASAAQRLERELRRNLRPHVSVQAAMQFEPGSLILTATVTLLSWSGAIVANAAKAEVEEVLGGLVRTALQRVIQPLISRDFGIMKIEVGGNAAVRPQPPPAQPARVEAQAPPVPAHGARPRRKAPSVQWLTYVVLGILLVGQLVLFIDRFFDVKLRETRSTESPVSARSTTSSLTMR